MGMQGLTAETDEIQVHREVQAVAPIWVYILFFGSGIPAVIYQIVWQRALFAIYGINIESVTIVVSAFMLGLGLGNLAGGALSRSRRFPLLAFFAVAELGIAIFGLMSLSVFHYVGNYTSLSPLWTIGIISFVLVVIPTTLMGSTLPILIEHLVRSSKNVGSSVGALYFVNTLGSGVACIILVRPLMNAWGQAGSLRGAALVNLAVGLSALFYSSRLKRQSEKPESVGEHSSRLMSMNGRPLPFFVAMVCAAFCGFVALSYEIIWYRLLAFASGDTAPVFASLLGSYLVGIALGSRFAEGFAERHSREAAIPALGVALLGSAIVSFWINPASALALRMISPENPADAWVGSLIFLLFICHATILFGMLFPLITHAAAGTDQAGTDVSYLYAANIAGSTAGVLLVGFVLMDKFPLYRIALTLLLGGVVCAGVVFRFSGRARLFTGRLAVFALVSAAAIVIAPASRSVFTTIYDRLLFKKFYPTMRFEQVVANRNGTIGVTPDGAVFGGGVYDGRFNTDLLHDSNIIVRPYALSAFHPAPSRVLMIGLSSGSWAQVIANHPQVEDLMVIEINPAYLEVIPKHPATASLLNNSKVRIVIDDGRRWLLHNPQAKFDVIAMNTSFYWRNHSTNLLSMDFLQIIRSHLKHNGVFFYNTTNSDDVVATGVAVFPYGLRIFNGLAVSDSPLTFDRERWRSVLLGYVIDGKHVIDSNDPQQVKQLDEIVNVIDSAPTGEWNSIETNDAMRARLQRRDNLLITDDNMGLEWR